MAPKIFLLGATGYIGGDVLYNLAQAHPEYEIACLARDSDKGSKVASQYAKTRLIHGNLDDDELLAKEAEKADIVLNTSGAFIIATPDLARKTFGEASTKISNDWDGIEEILSVPDWAPHRSADKLVIDGDTGTVKTAIICPPTIYGEGRGPNNQRSHQVPEMARCVLDRKQGFRVGVGENRMANVHVHDLSDCYLRLLEAAVEGGGKATWGKEGYYFTENGEHAFGQVATAIAAAAHKQSLIPSDEVATITEKEADGLAKWGAAMWGVNFRYEAVRARKLLGWSPSAKSLDDCIATTVGIEAKRQGLVQGHAARINQ
ncbi:hypothetical protein P7C71_g5029, partial [Lecanoromycetidae sp. Uapishka_2]